MTATVTAHPVPERTTPRRRRKSRSYPVFRVLVLTTTVLLFIAPLLWMLVASFKTNVDIYDSSKTFFFTPTMDNYSNVLGRNNYFDFIFNSFWVALWSTVFSLSLIHISEPTRRTPISYAVFCLKKKKTDYN